MVTRHAKLVVLVTKPTPVEPKKLRNMNHLSQYKMDRRFLGIMIIMSGKGRCLNLIALANRNRKINSVSADRRRADQKLLCMYKNSPLCFILSLDVNYFGLNKLRVTCKSSPRYFFFVIRWLFRILYLQFCWFFVESLQICSKKYSLCFNLFFFFDNDSFLWVFINSFRCHFSLVIIFLWIYKKFKPVKPNF